MASDGKAGTREKGKDRKEIKTTLDNEKLHTQSIRSKLSIYCDQTLERAANPRGAEAFSPPLAHASSFACYFLRDFSGLLQMESLLAG